MDFREQLAKQLRFLRSSSENDDAGDKDEGVRIAVNLRVIFHDTSKSRSLLRQLGKRKFALLSTCEDIPTGAKFWPNLTNMTIDPARDYADFFPKLQSARTKRFVPFDQWWTGETVYRVDCQEGFLLPNRKDLVLAAANKDGGAHVDEKLDPTYEKILSG